MLGSNEPVIKTIYKRELKKTKLKLRKRRKLEGEYLSQMWYFQNENLNGK